MAQRVGRTTASFRRLAASLRREQRPCWLCRQPIDYSAADGHPDAFTVDHIIPLSIDPSLAEVWTNLDAAHAACNKSRGNRNPKPSIGNGPRQW